MCIIMVGSLKTPFLFTLQDYCIKSLPPGIISVQIVITKAILWISVQQIPMIYTFECVCNVCSFSYKQVGLG